MATKQVREAQARVTELKAIIAEAEADVARSTQAVEPARKRRAALTAKQAKTLILTGAGGTPNARGGGISLATPATINLNRSYGDNALTRKPGELAAALLKGDQKVNPGGYGGIVYTLRGWARRGRIVNAILMRPVNAAIKRRKAAEDALDRAWKAEAEAYQAAFDAGAKIDEVALANDLAKRLAIWIEVKRDHELQRRADEALRYALPEAEAHLAFLKSGSTEPCPCRTCANDRQKAIRDRDEKARLDGLPTVMGVCPDESHGKHRITLDEPTALRLTDERVAQLEGVSPGITALFPKPERSWESPSVSCPRGVCRKGKEPVTFLRVAALRVELEKAAKEAAKAAKRAAKPKPKPRIVVTPTATGEPAELDWICPSCTEQSPFDVQTGDEDDEDAVWVECLYCGYEGNPDTVKTVAKAA